MTSIRALGLAAALLLTVAACGNGGENEAAESEAAESGDAAGFDDGAAFDAGTSAEEPPADPAGGESGGGDVGEVGVPAGPLPAQADDAERLLRREARVVVEVGDLAGASSTVTPRPLGTGRYEVT
jgi:hypothetical protein